MEKCNVYNINIYTHMNAFIKSETVLGKNFYDEEEKEGTGWLVSQACGLWNVGSCTAEGHIKKGKESGKTNERMKENEKVKEKN